jgi:GNAT superfamily N-acetyltransferase
LFDLTIRRAYPDEAIELTQLMQRSKAYWGYDESFMNRFRSEMRVSGEDIRAGIVYVLTNEVGDVLGFYRFLKPEGKLHLEDLFIDPEAIGQGNGRLLFQHAVSVARTLNVLEFTLEADPNAESFYLRMGAETVGWRESAIKGRFIPQMVYRTLE